MSEKMKAIGPIAYVPQRFIDLARRYGFSTAGMVPIRPPAVNEQGEPLITGRFGIVWTASVREAP